jgi:hypothetical protein
MFGCLSGRLVASLGNDYTQDILWIDYDFALSLHRVITGNVNDRRHKRLASATPLDNHAPIVRRMLAGTRAAITISLR